MNSITKLVLMRHGESQWNKENKFTGWVDVDLSEKGKIEAKCAGKILYDNNFIFDYGYTSMLKRAIRTLWIVLEQLNQMWLPIEKSWHLNERHYGALQGLNKDKVIKKYGYKMVQQWRRDVDTFPPCTTTDIYQNKRYNEIHDVRYKNINPHLLPHGESLSLTMQRVALYWNNSIVPHIKNNKLVIIVAHGNSIRAIIKFLDNLNSSEIFKINIPTGTPMVYEFDENANPIQHYYL